MIRLGKMHQVGQIRWRVLPLIPLLIAVWFFHIAVHPEQTRWPHRDVALIWRLIAGALFMGFTLAGFTILNPISIFLYRRRGLRALVNDEKVRGFSVQSDLTGRWKDGIMWVERGHALLQDRGRMLRIRSSEPSSELLFEFAKCAEDETRVPDSIWRSASEDRTVSLPLNDRTVNIRFGEDPDLERMRVAWEAPKVS